MNDSQAVVDSVFPRPYRCELTGGSLRLNGVQVTPTGFPRAESALESLFCSRGTVPVEFVRLDAGSGSRALGTEGYWLRITPTGIRIEANGDAGAFYAVQTLRQLLPVSVEERFGFELPCLVIEDRPLYEWRGFMLDVSRHMFPVEDIKQLLDWLALQKLNVFHWHLTDDGGWRMESKRFPNLTAQGAWREYRPDGWDYFDIRFPGADSGVQLYGGFYTQDEISDVIQYASERFITVVPEIDVPGHAMPMCASYPELQCTPESVATFVQETRMTAANVLCVGQPSTYQFMEELLAEVVDLFPSRVVHIGGDEVNHTLWDNCEHCQSLKAKLGVATSAQLQTHFVKELSRMLRAQGRILMGWDEILDDELVEGAMVMSWRGSEGGTVAAQRGHEVVMTPTKHCYFDYSYDVLPSETAFAFDPIKGVASQHAGNVKGGQANLWTEYVPTWMEIERRTFPRIAALAEALWTGPGTAQDWNRRLPFYAQRLDQMGIRYEGSPSLAGNKSAYQEGVIYIND